MKSNSQGLPVYIVPLILFSDDTSGNKSKKWNKFDYWSLSFANIPKEKSRAFRNIYFLCCSNRLTALDMAGPLVEDLKSLEQGIVVYDSSLTCNVVVITPVICMLCDNARGSELTNHLGSKATRFCRICMVCFTSSFWLFFFIVCFHPGM